MDDIPVTVQPPPINDLWAAEPGLRLAEASDRAAIELRRGGKQSRASRRDPGVEGHVIWFYAKQGRHLRCEVRQLAEGDRFDLVITDADGTERVEHFTDSASVTQRSLQLEAEWIHEGWDGPFGRDF